MTPDEISHSLLREAITGARRLLGEWNRIGYSKDAGSLGRDVWLYRLPAGFHPPTLQCAAYSLGRLFLFRHPDNPFYNSGRILSALRSAVSFTRSLQHRDGSFPEWYPSQRSFCATSYITAYLSMILPDLGKNWAEAHRDWLFRAGRWISRNIRVESANQLAAAACGLHHLSRWEGGEEFGPGKSSATDLLLKAQHEEGWFPEYGGADLGYLSLTLDFLSRIRSRSPSPGIDSSILRGLEFLAAAVLPDGTVSSICSRRATNFLMPFAIESLADLSPAAAVLRRKLLAGISAGTLPTPSTVDPRYCAHLFLPSFVDAAIRENVRVAPGNTRQGRAQADENSDTARVLPAARMACFSSRGLHAVISASKGGAFQGFLEGEHPISLYDAGYAIRVAGQWSLSSGPSEFLPDNGQALLKDSVLDIRVGGRGVSVPGLLLEPPGFLRTAVSLAGAIAGNIGMSDVWERCLKRAAFRDFPPSPFLFVRRIRMGEEGIHVEDRIRNPALLRIDDFQTASLPLPSAQPSSQFFTGSDLGWSFPLSVEDSGRIAIILTENGEILITRKIVREGSRWTAHGEAAGAPLQAGDDPGTASGHSEGKEP